MKDISRYKNKKRKDRRRSSYHLVFVPKYRRRLFAKPENREIVKGILM